MNATRDRQVIQTRITPPKTPQNIIARSDIVKLLSSSPDKKLLLVTAPAGYGKTTLVNEFINSSGKTTAWVHVTPDIKDVFNLLTYITSSLNRINEQFGDVIFETIQLIENDSGKINDIGSALGELAGLMINELLLKFHEELLIVIDDLHALQDSKNADRFFDLLINDLPDNIQLVIISRELPKLNLSQLRAKRLLAEVTQKELAFTKDEITALAADIYSKPLSGKELVYLQQTAGGWITGLHLVMQSLKENTEAQLSSIPVNLFDYLAEEIFSKLSEELRDFLLKTSHLENFDPPVCDFILNSHNSRELLAFLLNKNIFLESKHYITPEGLHVIIYDYAQLFRTFLTEKSKELLPEEIRKDILLKTSHYFRKNSNPEKALDYAVLSGSRNLSEDLLIENFEEFFLNGKFGKLWEWVGIISEFSGENSKFIIYYKGVLCKYYLGDLEKGLEYLNRAIGLSRKDDNEDFTITAVIMKMELMLNQGRTSDALETLLEMEHIETSAANKAKIFYFLGYIYFLNNDYDKALEYSNKALELCRNSEKNTISEDIYNLLGNINIIKGEFILSIHYYELTLSMTRSLQKKLLARGNLAILYSRSGKFRKARECYDETSKILRFFSSPVYEIIVKMTEYTLSFETGDYTSAFETASAINKLSLKLKNNHYIYLSFRFLGECSYYTGNFENAYKYHEIARKYINDSSESDIMLNLLLKTISRLNTASPDESEKNLVKAYDFLSSTGSNYDRLAAGFYLAGYYQMRGNPESSRQYLDIVFGLSKEKGYYSFLLREYFRSEDIFSNAGGKYKDMFRNFAESASEITELDWISDKYRKDLKKFIESKYDLKMLAFGGLRFFIKGNEIPEKKWIRKKRKLLLCYLLLSGNRSISKDKIVDVFFGDTPVESADNIFHQAVSNLRTALKVLPEHKQNETAGPAEHDYIIYEDKTLRLNPGLSYYCDLEDFDNLIKNSGSREEQPDNTESLKKAVSLYRGDALEGYYEDWCENIREEYRNKFIKCSEKLIELLELQNHPDEIIEYAEKLNNTDKLNIASVKAMVKAYIRSGKVNIARGKFEKFTALYKEEIGENLPDNVQKEFESMFIK